MQPRPTDISVHIFWSGLVLLAGCGLVMLVNEIFLQFVPGRDRPFLLIALGWLAFFAVYPAALMTLAGALALLDRPRPHK